jgi:hypothetical protein
MASSSRNSIVCGAKVLPLPELRVGSVKSSFSDLQQSPKPNPAFAEGKTVDPTAVEEQLTRILSSEYFRISERCRGLLRFLVDATLQDQIDLLKERLIGRDPSYDTSTDNSVRAAALEVRNRLVRYYATPEHVSELRILLYPGSYVPRFVRAETIAIAEPSNDSDSLVHRFWAPIFESNEPILIVLGPCHAADASKTSGDSILAGNAFGKLAEQVSLSDALSLAAIVSWIKACGKNYRVEMQDFVRYRDLRNGPAILLGGFNNQWTVAFAASFRFAFESNRENSKSWIRDSAVADQKKWGRDWNANPQKITEDYAIVARILHSETGRAMVVAGGHTMYGTAAAAEFLTSPLHLEEFASDHEDWESKDLEVVLATSVIRGVSGPPRIKATHVW